MITYNKLLNDKEDKLVRALPIKWCLAMSFNTSIYTSNVIGIPRNFKIKNGNTKKRMGTTKLIAGDIIFATDSI